MDILIIVMSGGVETPGAETGAVSIRDRFQRLGSVEMTVADS
jgi:hypothetical protein